MVVLTRAAARRLQLEEGDEESALVLRQPVTGLAATVWTFRNDVDIYTHSKRNETIKPEVDHLIEVQLTELALVRAFNRDQHSRTGSMATTQAREILASKFNGLPNLNVTSKRVNQAKRGPFTAGVNRLQSDRLRRVSIEQLARQGSNKWMVDDGTWARIERAIAVSYDHTYTELIDGGVDAMPAAATLVEDAVDELHSLLLSLSILR